MHTSRLYVLYNAGPRLIFCKEGRKNVVFVHIAFGFHGLISISPGHITFHFEVGTARQGRSCEMELSEE